MFLGVSGSVFGVEMNETERANFAKWLKGIQKRDYGDSAKAAYTFVGVNSNTWKRATTELPIKPVSVAKIVNAFRSDAEGDWTRLGFDRSESVGGSTQDAEGGYVSSPGARTDGGVSDSAVLDAIAEMRREMQRLQGEVSRLSERVDRDGSGS